MLKVDIVVVNWNAGRLLESCLDSVVRYGGCVLGKIIVVDNGSSDRSLSFIENFKNILVIRAGENLGFGRACNVGAEKCSSEFVLFLNPDARIYPQTLKRVVHFMTEKENQNVGICGVQLENEFGEVARSSSRFPSAGRLICQSLGLNKLFPRSGMPMTEWDHLTSRPVDQVIGAFFFVRRSLFDLLTGFDQRYFVYFEEVDFSYRAKLLGWESVFYAGTKAFHFGGWSSRQIKSKRLFYSLRSRLQYAHKHFNFLDMVLVGVCTLLIEPIVRLGNSVVRVSSSLFKENALAFYLLYAWVFKRS